MTCFESTADSYLTLTDREQSKLLIVLLGRVHNFKTLPLTLSCLMYCLVQRTIVKTGSANRDLAIQRAELLNLLLYIRLNTSLILNGFLK